MKGLLKKIAILAFLSFLVGVGGLIFLFVRQQSFPTQMQSVQESKSIDGSHVNRVEISAVTADVRVIKSNTEQINVKLHGETLHNQINLRVEKVGTDSVEIVVTETERFPFVFGHRRLDLEVALPDKQYQQLTLRTNTGDIASDLTLQATQCEVRSDTGDILLNGYTGDQLEASSETGDVDLNRIKGGVNIRTSTGSVDQLELLELAKDVDIETSTGDVTVKLLSLPTGASLEMESDTGEVRAQLPNLTYDKQEEKHIKATIGNGGVNLKVQSATGDLLIRN